jgi:hypothetical protein
MPLSDIERLAIIEDIQKMRASFVRFLDTKDWDALQALWTPDAVLDNTDQREARGDRVVGPATIIKYIRGGLDTAISVHHAHMPEIDILSPTTAKGVWAMEDRITWATGERAGMVNGFGHYTEDYEKLDGRWLVKTFRLTRLRVDVAR